MLSFYLFENLVGRWPLWTIFWVLEDGARRPSSYYGLPRRSCIMDLAKHIMNYELFKEL